MTDNGFRIFRGTGEAPGRDGPPALHQPPPWREFESPDEKLERPEEPPQDWARLVDDHVIDVVNAAIALRRPLLVNGPPGSGKSTLAAMIAVELGLGAVLHWPITSSSRLRPALYEYDAIGRLHDENQNRVAGKAGEVNVGRYVRLGPLGTALLPWSRPRVLLIDEIDKCDIDLPNELLHVFEIGWFTIPELARMSGEAPVEVMTEDEEPGGRAFVKGGRVRCSAFPVVVLTSNQERVFPAAFLRRCLRVTVEMPNPASLDEIVRKRVRNPRCVDELVARFEQVRGDKKDRAIDQLLHAVHLVSGANLGSNDRLIDQLFEDLGEAAT